MDRTHDVVLYGATGFTGRQTAAYFAAHAPADLRWAIAGRSRDKLEQVARSLPRPPPIVVADSADGAAVDDMVRQTRVILTTAGPFVRYGEPVAAAAVARGTHYCDITGESAWVRTLVDRFHAQAAREGTRIVPFCGFDSVPSDLGTWMLARAAGPLHEVIGAFSARGGVNGGTLASTIEMADRGEIRRMAEDLRLLDGGPLADWPQWRGVRWEPAFERWLAPFVMAMVNTRVVRRSASLLPEIYGPAFTYREAMETRSGVVAFGVRTGLGAGQLALRSRLGRGLARRLVRPPGEGPSEKAMDEGFFRARFVASAADGKRWYGIAGDRGDPGNRGTVKMLCQAALSLARDPLTSPGGVLTPATALGGFLLDRLRAAGMSWTVDELPPDGRVPDWKAP